MAKTKSTTTKKLTKQIGKILIKHGPEFALGLATGIVSDFLSSDAEKRTKKSMAGKAKKGTRKKAKAKNDDSKKSSAKKGSKTKKATAKKSSAKSKK